MLLLFCDIQVISVRLLSLNGFIAKYMCMMGQQQGNYEEGWGEMSSQLFACRRIDL